MNKLQFYILILIYIFSCSKYEKSIVITNKEKGSVLINDSDISDYIISEHQDKNDDVLYFLNLENDIYDFTIQASDTTIDIFSVIISGESYFCVDLESGEYDGFRIRNTKELILLLGENKTEINSDILYSVEGIKKYLKRNNIKLTTRYDLKQSGYLLINKTQKIINTAMTDVELLEICQEFYK